jgi:AraC-like DNA-binding protein
LVAAVWTLSAEAPGWIDHHATPDGCIEIIRRHAGRSVWRREQPEVFVTGLGERPVELRFSGDARFTGIRLWPWAWEALGGLPCRDFADDWIEAGPLFAAMTEGDAVANLEAALAGVSPPPIARAILTSTSVMQIVAATGLPHRALQRWFAAHIGLPPRSYLRLLRFRDAIAGVHGEETLADTAATFGYADQAHMARDFRALAGIPPSAARGRAKGPFV